MPGIMSGATALTLYTIEDPAAVTTEKLRKYAFRSIDNDGTESKAHGWTSIEDLLDVDWNFSMPEKGPFLCFALRVDTRKVPGPVLKKHLAEAIREEESKKNTAGKPGAVSRARKKELKELISARLLSQAEPVPSTVDVALDTQSGLLYVASVSSTQLELVCDYCKQSFGVTPQPVTAGVEDVPGLLRSLYESSRDVPFDGHTYTLAEAGQLTLLREGEENGAEVTVKNEADSARTGLETGLSIKKMKFQMERVGEEELAWEFTLDAGLRFSGLKTPRVEKQSDDDPDAVLLEKMYLLQQAVGVVRTVFEVK